MVIFGALLVLVGLSSFHIAISVPEATAIKQAGDPWIGLGDCNKMGLDVREQDKGLFGDAATI